MNTKQKITEIKLHLENIYNEIFRNDIHCLYVWKGDKTLDFAAEKRGKKWVSKAW